MLDAVSLDQLRTFIAAADEGSFSAAGRRLRRAQSVVSQTLANLEAQLGLALFDRGGRYPRLTEPGKLLLAEARAVLRGVDGFKSKARAISEGLEPELAVSVDVLYPMDSLTQAVGAFRQAFPHTPLRLFVEALGAVVMPVMDGVCRLAVAGSLPLVPEGMEAEHLLDVPLVTVVSPEHPLAALPAPIEPDEIVRHVQLVLTDRSAVTQGKDYGVLSPLVWRLADLGAKHAFLRAGFGWGHMPAALVAPDLAARTLVRIALRSPSANIPPLPMYAVYRKDLPPGPAGRWFLERLRSGKDARRK